MSAAEILDGIRAWVEIESHTSDLPGVQAMVAEVEGAYRALGATTERAPGQNGCGDHLIVRAPWNEQIYVHHAFDHPLYTKYIHPDASRHLPLAGEAGRT